MVNAWDRLYVGDKYSHMPQLSQAVPAAMSQVDRRHMRTRLLSNTTTTGWTKTGSDVKVGAQARPKNFVVLVSSTSKGVVSRRRELT